MIKQSADLRPVTTGNENDSSPRWSPDGQRLAYASSRDGAEQIYVRWMDTGQIAKVTNLPKAPDHLAWSPDGHWIAFTMFVPADTKPFAEMPPKPDGADWGKPAKVVQKLTYRFDGKGYLEDGYRHLFLVPAEGGTARQLTQGDFHHDGPLAWTPDGRAILFSANRHENWEFGNLIHHNYRTPISESEQYYQALKLRQIDTALVRLPEASHSMDARPTQLIAKVAHILKWFANYRTDTKQE